MTRALVVAARLLIDAGRAVVIDGAAPVPEVDRLARELIHEFALVKLVCPVDDYDPPLHPDLIVYTDVVSHRTAAEEVVRLVERLERAAQGRRQETACSSSR